MSDEDGNGIGNLTSTILIIVVVLALILLLPGTAWPKVRESFVGIVGEKGELKEKFDKAFNEKEINLENEQKEVEEIHKFFNEKFNTADDDCVSLIDFSSIKEKNFDLEINGNRRFLISKNSLREYPLNINKEITYLKNGVLFTSFSLTDNFNEINGESFSEVLYKKGNDFYLMDEFSSADLSGKYSPVFAKKECSKNNIQEIVKVPYKFKEAVLIDYLMNDFSYFDGYKNYDIIANIVILNSKGEGLYRQEWDKRLRESAEEYFNNFYGEGSNTIRLIVSYVPPEKEKLPVTLFYDFEIGNHNIKGEDEIVEMGLEDGTIITLRIII